MDAVKGICQSSIQASAYIPEGEMSILPYFIFIIARDCIFYTHNVLVFDYL
jgi:hypothetical protein